MRVPDPDEERPVSWLAIFEHTPVYSSDGEHVGGVREVVGSEAEDIFHGLVVDLGVLSRHVLVPAERVGDITNRRVDIKLSGEDIRALPPYAEEDSYQLGFVGMFSKRLGWTGEGKGPH